MSNKTLDSDSDRILYTLVQKHWNVAPTAIVPREETHRAVWKIETATAPYYLKRYNFQSDEASIVWEHRLIQGLETSDFPYGLPIPIPMQCGKTTLTHNDHLWSLAQAVPGRDLRIADLIPDCADQIGEMLAHFHRIGAQSGLKQRPGCHEMLSLEWLEIPGHDLEKLKKAIGQTQPSNPVEKTFLATGQMMIGELDRIHTVLRAHFQNRYDEIPLHGDFSPWNVLMDEDGTITGIVDFEFSHLGYRIADLARIADHKPQTGSPYGTAHLDWIMGLLRGYTSVLPLTDIEMATLPEWMRFYYVTGYISVLAQWVLNGPYRALWKDLPQVYVDLLPNYLKLKNKQTQLIKLLADRIPF